jgi:hypothetical protein
LIVKKTALVTAALVAAVAVLVVLILPPAPLALPTPFSDGTVTGILHVHTNRSDGRGTPDEVAAAAAKAGLKFIVMTDHGDGTRVPDPPVYRAGVLCIDAVEISTSEGHYVALGMAPAPYPLNGEGRDVVEDVGRLGGFGVVAHPESPKPTLAWHAWDTPFDGIEWVNPDTSWRVLLHDGWWSRFTLARALATYPLRPEASIASLLGGTSLSIDRWNAVTRSRRVVVLAGADSHANLALGTSDSTTTGISIPIPSYQASFGALSVHARPARALSGDAVVDAAAVLAAIRAGHVYVAIDGLASPAAFELTAAGPDRSVEEGDEIPANSPVTLSVRSNAPASFTTVVWRDDRRLMTFPGGAERRHVVTVPGAYRVEVDAAGSVPWLMSNPIYVGTLPPLVPAAPRPTSASQALFDGRTAVGWWTESDPRSTASVDTADGGIRLRYTLGGGTSSGQFAALATRLPRPNRYDRIALTVRSEEPMRISVQLRTPDPGSARWQRSIYLDQHPRDYTIDFGEMTPADDPAGPRLDARQIRDLLVVIDTTHTRPGASGRLWITRAVLERSAP